MSIMKSVNKRTLIDPKRIEVIDDMTAEILRHKTGAERLRMAFGMFAFARKMVVASIRETHPDWSEEQINQAAARRMSHGAI